MQDQINQIESILTKLGFKAVNPNKQIFQHPIHGAIRIETPTFEAVLEALIGIGERKINKD